MLRGLPRPIDACVIAVMVAASLVACRAASDEDSGSSAPAGAPSGAVAPTPAPPDEVPRSGGASYGVPPAVGASAHGAGLPVHTDLLGAPSSGASTIDVREYFPQPAPGTTIVTELAYTDASGQATPYSVQRYRRRAENDGFYLEDYRILANGGLGWLDTWFYRVDDSGVKEVYDSAPTWTFSQFAHPLDHGLTLTKGVGLRSIAFEDGQDGTHDLNHYWVHLDDVKRSIVLPAGSFANVAVQAEQQLKCTTSANCASGLFEPFPSSVRYRFAFAPGRGIVAQVYYDDAWRYVSFLYATKSCQKTEADFRCD